MASSSSSSSSKYERLKAEFEQRVKMRIMDLRAMGMSFSAITKILYGRLYREESI